MDEYSQKYTLVSLIDPMLEGTVFHYSDWPQHVTIVDTFSCDLEYIMGVRDIVNATSPIEIAGNEHRVFSDLGRSIPVILMTRTAEIVKLHEAILDYLLEKGAVLNSSEFARRGFLPHTAAKDSTKIGVGTKVVLSSVSIVDMFVDGDWQKRKVLKTFDFVH